MNAAVCGVQAASALSVTGAVRVACELLAAFVFRYQRPAPGALGKMSNHFLISLQRESMRQKGGDVILGNVLGRLVVRGLCHYFASPSQKWGQLS